MADNVEVDTGTGITVATDEVAGAHIQRVKIGLGADGSASDALGGAGNVAAGVQRVTLAADDPAVVDLAAIEVLLGTIDTDTGNIATSVAGATPAGTNLIGKVDHSSTGLGDGVTTVTTAGTDVALAGSTTAKWVIIQSQTDNTGKIAVGVTGVDATIATGDGVLLSAGESITLPIDNLADVFIDSTVNGEGVRYIYGT